VTDRRKAGKRHAHADESTPGDPQYIGVPNHPLVGMTALTAADVGMTALIPADVRV
jgi:hypothetical protein